MVEVETLLQAGSLCLGIASAVIAVSILRRQRNENTEVSWRYLIASAVAFALAQFFSILKSLEVPGFEGLLAYEPEAAYLVFALLFLLGISRQHQVARNSDID